MHDVFNEFLAHLVAVWRRRWYALALAWLICFVGWGVVAVLPDKYESEARVYIDTSSLLGPLLKGITVESDVDKEVAIMQRTLLSRPNLAEVARATDLDLEATTPIEIENMLGRLKDNASITAQGRNLFTVSYTDKDPVLAKSVVQALLTIFVETNLGRNRQDMENARSFIEAQLETYQQQIRDAERRIADFRSKHANVIQAGSFVAQLNAARDKAQAAKLEYEDAVLARDQLKAQLERTPQFLKLETAPQVVMTGQQSSPSQVRLEKLQENLDQLRLQYTENHPDVISLVRSIENLRKSMEKEADDAPEAEKASATVAKSEIPNALYQQLEMKLSEIEPKFVVLRRNLASAEAEVRRLDELRLTAPEIETQLKDLERDYAIIKGKYDEFLSRREAAKISQAAEATTDAIQFRIISPPQVPIRPSAPKRELLIAAVMLVALGGGAGFAFLLGQIDGTIGAGRSLSETFGIAVIGTVSLIVSTKDKFRHALSNVGFGIALGSLVALCIAMVIFAPELTKLPQLLQQQQLPSQLAWIRDIVISFANMPFLKEL
ncbi:MAG: XrtA system polysaccharide chain length determinant [Alphaproteobacteria bacterium]